MHVHVHVHVGMLTVTMLRQCQCGHVKRCIGVWHGALDSSPNTKHGCQSHASIFVASNCTLISVLDLVPRILSQAAVTKVFNRAVTDAGPALITAAMFGTHLALTGETLSVAQTYVKQQPTSGR